MEEGIVQGEFPASLDPQVVTRELYYLWLGATLLTKVHRDRTALECAFKATCDRLQLVA
jgi:TetR/AcrR family transcriptional repressor of nem operon